jgi:tRNA1(Val) A37 N6-methylase TrmN6
MMKSQTSTQDRLLGGRVAIAQPEDGYRVSIDAVFLAASVKPKAGARVLDVGCGDGGATLCLAWRAPQISVSGLDLRPDAIARFSASVELNGWSDRVRGYVHDVAHGTPAQFGTDFDWVISNPPYLPEDRMDHRGKGEALNPATTETVPLSQWIAFMAACIGDGGHFALVHRADRIEDVLVALSPHAGDIKVLPLWPKSGASAKRVIVIARRGARGPSEILSGLVLHEDDGSFTQAAQAILIEGEALMTN